MNQEAENTPIKFAFFGTPQFAVGVLDELKKTGLIPSLMVTAPDKPRGRKLVITPPEAKVWARAHGIEVWQPNKLNEINHQLKTKNFDVFLVVAYGKLIPKSILEIPKHGVLNVHPSLLPKLRGASPIQSAILTEEKTGVSIILLDEEMDHGPIVAQKEYVSENWPPKTSVLERDLAQLGGQILAETFPKYLAGEITLNPQDHTQATYTKKIQKEDGLLDLTDDPEKNFRKIQAFNVWPRAFFFAERKGKKIRIIVTDAELVEEKLIIKKVLPEGQNETPYEEFLRKNK